MSYSYDEDDGSDDVELGVVCKVPTPQHALKFGGNRMSYLIYLGILMLTISSTGKRVLIYRIFLHQYFGQLTWSIVGGSKTDCVARYFMVTSTTPRTNKYGAVNLKIN